MIPLTIALKADVGKIKALTTKRGLRKILRDMWIAMVLRWHERFVGKHFESGARGKYQYRGRRRKRRGVDMVATGTLRRRITRKVGRSDIRATFRGAKLSMPIGRPAAYSAKRLRQQVAILMNEEKISRKEAQSRVFRKATYGTKNKRLFQQWITAVTGGEVSSMKQLGVKLIVGGVAKASRGKRKVTPSQLRAIIRG